MKSKAATAVGWVGCSRIFRTTLEFTMRDVLWQVNGPNSPCDTNLAAHQLSLLNLQLWAEITAQPQQE